MKTFITLLAFLAYIALMVTLFKPGLGIGQRFQMALRGFASDMGYLEIETINQELDAAKEKRRKAHESMGEIFRTAKAEERVLTEDEKKRYDEAKVEFDAAETLLDELAEKSASATRSADYDKIKERAVPKINLISDPPASANRSLDELLWATLEEVPAGSISQNGHFLPNQFGARNAVEQVYVRNQNEDIALAPRIGDFRAEHQATIRHFQRTVADMILFGFMVDRSAKSSRDAFASARADKRMKERFEHSLRALDVDTAAEGGNWVPTGIGADLHEKVRAAGRVAPLFPRVDMPTNPWKWPLEGADAVAYRVPEPTSDTATKVTASTPGTGAATFDAEIFGGRILFSRSMEADSAIAVLPFVKFKLARAFVDAEERAIINGDTDGTHQDTDTQAVGATDAATAWDGLRKRGIANTFVNGGSAIVTLALLRGARAAMGKWGLNPADIAIITSIAAYYDLLATSDVTTVDKMGAAATILNGQLGSIDGTPIIVSEHFREDMNATGVNDGVTTTQTGLVVVNRGAWVMGQRMGLDVEVDDSIYRESYQRVVVGFMREDFQNLGESTDDDTAYLYNLD